MKRLLEEMKLFAIFLLMPAAALCGLVYLGSEAGADRAKEQMVKTFAVISQVTDGQPRQFADLPSGPYVVECIVDPSSGTAVLRLSVPRADIHYLVRDVPRWMLTHGNRYHKGSGFWWSTS